MYKVMIVFGTRPEAIKMAPLVKEFQKQRKKVQPIICVSGQHREMLDQVLDLFDIQPDYDLKVMKKGQDLYDVTINVISKIKNVLLNEKPDIVFVHGDTTTSMSAALASYYQKIPVAHVEAGLRTYNIYSPWPEEINRQIITRISKYHFAPTENNKINLLNESVESKNIVITGNTVIDSINYISQKINDDIKINENTINAIIDAGYNNIKKNKKIVLITAHRRENYGKGIEDILSALKTLINKYKNVDFIYPMHLNPNVRKSINKIFGSNYKANHNMYFIEPIEYMPFVFLMKKSNIVLTDSGGIQEEAPGLGKPVLVLRENTERPEAINTGTVKLVGTNYDKIIKEVSELLENKDYYTKMSEAINPFGDGTASQKIVQYILNN